MKECLNEDWVFADIDMEGLGSPLPCRLDQRRRGAIQSEISSSASMY